MQDSSVRGVSTSTPDGIIRNRQVDMAKLEPGAWDGRELPYLPQIDLRIDPSLKLHTGFDLDVDPITYQVLRSRFWNLNLDHSDTIKRMSGSPIVIYMDDFNTSLLTENGDTIVSGPSVQYFTGHGDLVVKWTLENRSANPGIEDGDIFLQNDPYIGTEHQMDVMTYAPIFWEGALFCWVLSNAHIGDIGGTEPGSFCPQAPDIFSEATPVPPIKLARAGVLQEDVVDMFARKSRTPDQVRLQLRSQLAGLRVTRERIHEMLEEYGPLVVKGTMRAMIRDCSEAVGRRLEQIPDGEWTETLYIGSASPGDRGVHRISTTVRKEGDRLYLTNEGSDPQFMSASAPFSAWRSSLMCAGAALFGYDQFNCPAGVADHMEFLPIPGTMTCARYPAAVGTLTAALLTVYLASQVLSKMALAGPPNVRKTANASGGISCPSFWVGVGLDRNGKFVAESPGDPTAGSIGAFPDRDGIDTGGAWWWPNSNAGNVENWEAASPILYLFRREQADSGGAGLWRGGNGIQVCVIPHKTTNFTAMIVSNDPAINTSAGLAGGMPGHPGNHLASMGSSIRELFGDGKLPASRSDLEDVFGTMTRIDPKTVSGLTDADVLVIDFSGGGGYGDPLLRELDHVASDLEHGLISEDHAREHYGVVVDSGVLDVGASEFQRVQAVQVRMSRSRPPISPVLGSVDASRVRPLSGALGVSFERGSAEWACCGCGQLLGSADANFKDGTCINEASPFDIDPVAYPNPADFCDVPFVLRRYLCPSCGVCLGSECAATEDPPAHDMKLLPAGLRALAEAAS